jgi:hypothetical protein
MKDEAASDEIACPKCGAKQPPGPACRKCGLSADRMATFQRQKTGVASSLVVAWKDCETAWTDETAHDKFMELVVEQEAYAFAARRYRDALAARPGDPIAQQHVDQVAKMVAANLMVSATPKESSSPKPYKNAITILVVLVVAIVIGVVYATLRGSSDTDALAPSTNQRR